MPLISIIIPTLNVAAKLQVSLRSVTQLQAPFQDLEVLVMDGASVDETVEVAQRAALVDKRIRVWSEPDNGIFDGMNKGIERAGGRFLYFMGAGDLMHVGVLSELEQLPDLHPLLLLHGQVWHPGANVAPDAGANLKVIDLARYSIPHQGAFYGREIFQVVGLYNPKYRLSADHELNFRCWTDARIETRFWSRIVADFELGGASSSLYDPDFARDWPGLVWKRGGLWPYLAFRASQRTTPQLMNRLRRLRAALKRLKGRRA